LQHCNTNWMAASMIEQENCHLWAQLSDGGGGRQTCECGRRKR